MTSLSAQIVMSDSTKGGIDMLRSSIAEQPIKNAPTPEEIRQRAYEIHIERGGFYGCDMDDLLQAERELQQKHRNNEKYSKKKRKDGVLGRRESACRADALVWDYSQLATIRCPTYFTRIHNIEP
jgi:Protein of unknown function (DUF2934)